MTTATPDIRFDEPLYTLAEAGRFLGVSPGTLATWAKGYDRSDSQPVHGCPLVTRMQAEHQFPSIPFVGLAEAMVIAAFKRAGVSLRRIRPAVDALEHGIGLDHALASKSLVTEGAVILYESAVRSDTGWLPAHLAGLTEVVSDQQVFVPVIADSLSRIEYDDAGWAARLISPITRRQVVIADPARSFGQPIFIRGAVRVEDVVDRLRAGDPLDEVAEDFRVPIEDIQEVLGVAVPLAA